MPVTSFKYITLNEAVKYKGNIDEILKAVVKLTFDKHYDIREDFRCTEVQRLSEKTVYEFNVTRVR